MPCLRQTLEPSTPRDVAIPFGSLTTNQAVPFHPRGFSPPRWFTPCSEPQMYCNLMPDKVRHVSRTEHPSSPLDAEAPDQTVRPPLLVPRNAVHTLRRIPLASSRTASLRPLPSCCCRPSSTPDTERRQLSSIRSSLALPSREHKCPVPELHSITSQLFYP